MTRIVGVVPAYDPQPGLVALVGDFVTQVQHVVVVDDGSGAGTAETIWAGCRSAGATVLHHAGNRGIAAALNTGVAWAAGVGADAVLTVDQDSEVPPGLVTALRRRWTSAAENGCPVGVVAPESVAGLPRQRDGRPPIQSGQLVPMETFERVGPFDEGLFIDGVDDDFALRCLDAGLAVCVAPGVVLGHRLGAVQPLRAGGREVTLVRSAPFRSYYLARNRVGLVRRHGRRHPAWATAQVLGLGRHLASMLLLAPERGQRARAVVAGLRDAASGRTGRRPS